MKTMKKLASAVLALAMVLSLSVSALAAQEGTLTGGSITIDNAVAGQTYNVYQILYLESYNATSGAYAYKANSAWETWLKTQTTYVSFDDQGYVTWVKGADAAAFAKLAQEKAKTMTADAEPVTATTTTVEFPGLKLGYYLVDSTLGTLCSLDTTNPDVTIKEKNGAPTVDKQVKEDSTDTWGETNDADIGQTVEFKGAITLPIGSENVVFYDKMSVGLTLNETSIKVYTDMGMTTELATSNYALDTTAVEGENGYTFKITFTQAYLDGLTAETKLYVYYTATVNENAVIALPGNPNDDWLQYGDENNTTTTPKNETVTYTWDMDVLKYANGNESTVLKDAQFVLLSSDKSKVATIVNGKITGWADVPTGDAEWPANTVLTTGENGKIEIDGLDSDTYYLREIKAPDGYNKLNEDIKVEITGATKGDNNALTYTTVIAKVNNQSGTELPSTGGMGTTIFYVVGGVLVLAAAVLLITRRRMKAED